MAGTGNDYAVEFRGCRRLVFAEVLIDDEENYTVGDVIDLAPVAEISKTVETSSEAHYYDNHAAIVINSEGADTVTLTIAVPSPEVYSKIAGRTYFPAQNSVVETERETKYFALGYVLGEVGSANGERERYVWRYKGTFNLPDETSATKNDGTDANNMSLEYTGIYTKHEFMDSQSPAQKIGRAKAAFSYSGDEFTETEWFTTVMTPTMIYDH